MPAVSTLSLCEHTLDTNSFNSSNVYEPIDPPGWFVWNFPTIDPGPPIVYGYSYQVTAAAPLGTHTIYLDEFDHYIVITVTDCAIVVNTCLLTSGSIGPIDPPPGGENFWAYHSGDDPDNITFDQETQTISYLVTTIGTHWIVLLSDQDSLWLVYKIVVTNCEIEACADSENIIRIVWLNPTGGWSSYIFSAKKTYNVDIGGSRTFKDENRITKYLQIDNVYDGVIQPSGFIPETHVDFLKSLRYSIQAYVYDVISGDEVVCREIFNYAKSFELKKQSNGFYKYDFDFNYGEEIITQTR